MLIAEERKKKEKKLQRDITGVIQAHDDDDYDVSQETQVTDDDSFEVTFANEDERTSDHSNLSSESLDDTLVMDEEIEAPNKKKKRRFKRMYLQPQPRRVRK